MKRLTLVLAAVAVVFYLGGTPALAQHGHGGGTGHSGPSAGGPSGRPGSGSEPGRPTTETSGRKTVTQQLTAHPQLASKLAGLVGSKFTTAQLQTACSGLKNFGRCVAAVHVWHNLGLSTSGKFPDTTASTGFANWVSTVESKGLGKAIQSADPSVNAKSEAKKGQRQANDDLKESSS